MEVGGMPHAKKPHGSRHWKRVESLTGSPRTKSQKRIKALSDNARPPPQLFSKPVEVLTGRGWLCFGNREKRYPKHREKDGNAETWLWRMQRRPSKS